MGQNVQVLLLPGIGSSGPKHWQTLWEQSQKGFQRVQQRDWDHPVCAEWVGTLEKAVISAGPDIILVAHSLACLLVAHWAAETQCKIQSALLVAVPDPLSPVFPKETIGFSPFPGKRLPFHSILAASTNDPYASIQFAERCASAWGSRLVNVGSAGHINTSSDLGRWPEGFQLLQDLIAATGTEIQ